MQNTTELPRRIALIGMMGCGKSSIGQSLAAKLDLPFTDTDKEIEKRVGISISEVFAQLGESYFRTQEYSVISELTAQPAFLVSLGGGAYLQEEVRKAIGGIATTIYLRVPPEILWERVSQDNSRPLAQDGYDKFKALLESRRPVYETANIIIDCNKDSKSTITQNIIATLQTA